MVKALGSRGGLVVRALDSSGGPVDGAVDNQISLVLRAPGDP